MVPVRKLNALVVYVFLVNEKLTLVSPPSFPDIWNGNAAVQLQPPMGPDEQPLVLAPPPTVVLDRVEISSASGRGIVNIDGGLVNISNCYVHDCAATGIYVGGPGSRANIERTDVVRNGNGNTQHRRGIARGHSGIYLEQGHASIVDCNVSQNSLTGISAVSPENAILTLQGSDLMSNGTYQLEMPAVGTVAQRNSITSNNNLSNTGFARSRSGLMMED
jgi:Right handed beta helix region